MIAAPPSPGGLILSHGYLPILERALIAAVAAFALTAAAIPLLRRAALCLEILALPDDRDRRTVPLMGGWAIIGSIVATLALVGDPPPLWMLIGACGLILTGQYDDWRALPPRRKLLLEIIVLVASVAVFPGPVLNPARLPVVLLSGLFLLVSINAYNLIDGLDGLAAGVGIASALGVSIVGVLNGNLELSVAGFAVAGALGGFMLFNYAPARIFMGDCGALPLGFLLGALALQTGMNVRSATISAAVPILLMLVPLLDIATVSLGRSLRGSPLTRRGRDHAHYKLIALGIGEVQVAALCWTIAAAASLSAVIIFAAPRAMATLLLPLVVLPFAILARAVLELDETSVSAPSTEHRDSVIPDHLRLTLTITIDALAVAAAFIGAALLRLGSAVTPAEAAAALWSNLPIVLVAAMFTLTGVGAYRRASRDTIKIEWARLGGASAAAGIILVLIDYWAPLIFSGWIALLFVVLLFGALAAARATAVLPHPVFGAELYFRAPTEMGTANSIAAAPNNGISNEN